MAVPRTVLANAARLVPLLGLGALVGACKGGSAPPPPPRTVFDPGASLSAGPDSSRDLEVPFSGLDRQVGARRVPWIGVSVLRNGVHFSRPSRWMVREGSVTPGQSYIRYISPDAFSFAIYERTDSPSDAWKDIEQLFEEDVAAVGAKAVGRRVPMATAMNQGRAFTVERAQPAFSRSREIILRSEHRVVLVQIVSQGADLSRLSGELLEVFNHFEVL